MMTKLCLLLVVALCGDRVLGAAIAPVVEAPENAPTVQAAEVPQKHEVMMVQLEKTVAQVVMPMLLTQMTAAANESFIENFKNDFFNSLGLLFAIGATAYSFGYQINQSPVCSSYGSARLDTARVLFPKPLTKLQLGELFGVSSKDPAIEKAIAELNKEIKTLTDAAASTTKPLSELEKKENAKKLKNKKRDLGLKVGEQRKLIRKSTTQIAKIFDTIKEATANVPIPKIEIDKVQVPAYVVPDEEPETIAIERFFQLLSDPKTPFVIFEKDFKTHKFLVKFKCDILKSLNIKKKAN